MPVNPNTTRQASIRGLFATWSGAWQALTDNQRASWNTYASAHPRLDSLGQSITLSGFQVYMGLNTNLEYAGLGPITAVPAGEPPGLNGLHDVLFQSDGVMTVDIDAAVESGEVFQLDAYRPNPLGSAFFGTPIRMVNQSTGAASRTLSFGTEFTARWGLPLVGQVVRIRARTVSPTRGVGPWETIQEIVTAP